MMKLASGPSRNAATERPRPWWRPVEPATLRSSFETPVPFRVQLRLGERRHDDARTDGVDASVPLGFADSKINEPSRHYRSLARCLRPAVSGIRYA